MENQTESDIECDMRMQDFFMLHGALRNLNSMTTYGHLQSLSLAKSVCTPQAAI